MPEADGTPLGGWFRSPGGVLAHADGPAQVRAYVDRGYTAVDDDTAKQEIGDGLRLVVERAGSDGTFDAEGVATAVKNEGSQARSAAARKGAATKRAKKAAADKAARDAANTESDALTTEG